MKASYWCCLTPVLFPAACWGWNSSWAWHVQLKMSFKFLFLISLKACEATVSGPETHVSSFAFARPLHTRCVFVSPWYIGHSGVTFQPCQARSGNSLHKRTLALPQLQKDVKLAPASPPTVLCTDYAWPSLFGPPARPRLPADPTTPHYPSLHPTTPPHPCTLNEH